MHDCTPRAYARQAVRSTTCICNPYAVAMVSRAKDTHTTNRVVRVADLDWEALKIAVGERHRAQLIRDFIAWYLRRPGAKLPTRPPATGDS